MRKELITVEINKIKLKDISSRDLSSLEIPFIAETVSKRMNEIEEETGYPDTLQLALRAAMSFASELYIRQLQENALRKTGLQQIDEMIQKLEISLRKKQKR